MIELTTEKKIRRKKLSTICTELPFITFIDEKTHINMWRFGVGKKGNFVIDKNVSGKWVNKFKTK